MKARLLGENPALSAFGVLLAVHAHPDDETLSTGGLLATWAAAGRPALVVTCTRGERGEVIALPGTTSEGLAGLEGDGPALGAYRETELAGALAELAGGDVGAIEQTFLDAVPFSDAPVAGATHGSDPSGGVRYEDSGMAWAAPGVAGPAPDSPPTAFARVPLDEPAGRLAMLIRARRPAVVATYEPGGGYGHPDHVRTHAVTVRALELAADPAWRPDGGGAQAADGEPAPGVGRRDEPWAGAELWQAVARAAEVREARALLADLPEAGALAAAAGLTFADPWEDLPPFAKDDLDTATSGPEVVQVDIGLVADRLIAALRAHATQVQHATVLPRPEGPVVGWYALSNDVLAPILTTETYLVTPPR
ncbi:N-acetyl-1-D-myo-inositol-2-amino-2-deoxy-alpha-D-glucopyranoside deacetylase [Promicromonospora sp. AC04]|nr:N-acetyl-1-D-myo-inositol-2-amino-2-deoxy-alpha-D-glucopyranoside deacetylase [Promicromonospora sp. AC04]